MNRILVSLAAVLGALTPLIFDSALKGAALLAVAALTALLLFKASAATRHLVWFVAVVALLIAPLLSVALPQWRVLPAWTTSPLAEPTTPSVRAVIPERSGAPDVISSPPLLPQTTQFPAPAPEFAAAPTLAERGALPVTAAVPPVASTVPKASGNWRDWLPLAWTAGFVLLALRLLAAHLLLRRAARDCAALTAPPDGFIAAASAAASAQLGIRQRVTLLLDEKRTIPVVWGVFRPRLLLPAEAREWNEEQLRSVLLHELAHIRRRDTLVQWITQIACALHWFNPLVWLAAWRLHAERERACDDLVLASGVRPSAYAEHLLHVATKLSPARWTAACGLAMARKSSLEGRLLAVLSEKLNRRGVTSALAASALILGAGIAIPVAMLRAADEKWNPPQAAHIGTNDFSAYCVHDGKDTSFVIAYHGFTGSSSAHESNPKTRTWTDSGTLTAKKPGIALSFHRTHTAPGKLSITTAPAEGRDLSKPAPPPRDFGQKEYDLAKGRVFLLTDTGLVRQFDLPAPVVTDQESKKKLAALIASIPPQQREDLIQNANTTLKLQPETEAQLDWGEPVNGLRSAIIIRSAKPGDAPGIFLAVQNVSDAALRFNDSLAAKEQRKLYLSDSAGILMALTSSEPTKTDAVLPPREIVFLPMFPASPEKTGEAALIEGIRKDSLQSWRAVLEINNAPDGTWKGKLTTGETRCAATEGPQPKTEEGRALFKLWQNTARLNGDIPGGLLARLHDKVTEFIRNNIGDASGDPYAKKMAPLEPRFGVAGDWKPADVVALLDDIAAVHTIPLATTLDHLTQRTLQHGQPLPAALEKVDWGEPLAGGLRMAHVLEPRAVAYALGMEVKARILLHNSGQEHVAFITSSFEQPGHKAKRADGSELKLDATEWLTLGRAQAYRLAPGEFIEVNTPGLGIGAHDKDEDKHRAEWSDVRAGSWILCSDGDEVTFLPGGIMLSYDDSKLDGEPRPWWPDFIAERLSREAPVPLDTTEREHLLYRVVRDLFGTAPSTTEGDAFAADKSPDALKNLAALLAKHPYGKQCEGMIQPGETKFRVLPVDPDAAKKPRVVMNSGRYTLGNGVNLFVTRRGQGARLINEGSVSHYPPGKDHVAHDLKLPDGHDTWAAGWEPGSTVLWLAQKGLLRSFDFTDPAAVKETRYEGDQTATAPIPAALRALIGAALTTLDAPKQIHEPLPPASTAPASESPKPKDKVARALYEVWQRHARTNGDLPGALIGELAIGVRRFIKYNPTWESVPALNEILSRLDATRDWKSADAIALLDEVAAVKDSPIGMTLSDENDRVIGPGQPLPQEFADKPWIWSKEDASGLRIGWDLEPRPRPQQATTGGEEWISPIAPGTALRARLFIHNAGKQPVVVRVPTWHQGGVTAVNKDEEPIEVHGISWTTLASLATHRLAPGEYVSINAPGVGFGKDAGRGPWAGPRVGWNLEAEPGDRVCLTHAALPCDASHVGRRQIDPIEDGPAWWTEFVKARLARGLTAAADKSDAITLPAPADRALLLDRACRDLFGTDPTAAERTAFDAVNSRATLFIFAEKLAQRPGITSFDGTLTPAPASFEIQKPVPATAERPRVVLGPGEYPLPSASARRGDVTLKIVGRPVGDRRTNDAQLIFEATEFTGARPPDPHKLEVPDGWGAWAIVCRPSDGFFYLLHKGSARKIDYSDPREVTDTPVNDLPAEFRDEVKRQLDLHEVSAESQAEVFEKPAPPATTPKPKVGDTGSKLPDPDEAQLFQAKGPGTHDLAPGVQLIIGGAPGGDRKHATIVWRRDSGATADGETELEFTGPADAPFVWGKGSTALWVMRADRLTWIDFSKPGEITTTQVAWHQASTKGSHSHAHSKATPAPTAPSIARDPSKPQATPEGPQSKDAEALTLEQVERFVPRNAEGAFKLGLIDAHHIAADPPMRDFLTGRDVEVTGTLARSGKELIFHTMHLTCCSASAFPVRISISLEAESPQISGFAISRLSGKLKFVEVEGRFETRLVVSKFKEGPEPSTDSPPATTPEPKSAEAAPKPDSAYAKSGIPLGELGKQVEWSGAETKGLRLGIHIPNDAVWRTGEEVKAEVWVHNASETDVKFSHSPRKDVGLSVVAKGADGREHFADITRFRGKPGYHRLLLPAGNVVKLKEFTMKLGAKKDGERVNLGLPLGDYKLRAVWSDTTSHAVPEGEWSAKLTTGEVSFKLTAAKAGADAGKPAAKPPGANIVKAPDDQYVKSGGPGDELAGEGVIWNDPQNGLSLGYRITGDEWRILGNEVKVELWVRNPGDEDVKFQLNMLPDIGLRMKMKSEKGVEQESNILPTDVPPFGEHRLLPPGHALKVKEFTVSLLRRGNDVSGIKEHYFLIEPGAYHFHCELELPGFSATGEGGKQLTPAAGEWDGKLTTRSLNVMVVTPDAPAPKSAEASPRSDGARLLPKHESAQSLLKSWQRYARSDGKIPGGLIAALADIVDWTLWTDGWLPRREPIRRRDWQRCDSRTPA